MRDIAWDIDSSDGRFPANDILFLNGDLRTVSPTGQQNAALLIMKSAADILHPEYGLGFEEIYPNLNTAELPELMADATNQIYDDGGATVTIYPVSDPYGNTLITGDVKYKGE